MTEEQESVELIAYRRMLQEQAVARRKRLAAFWGQPNDPPKR